MLATQPQINILTSNIQILNQFNRYFKPKNQHKTGLEYERISLYSDNSLINDHHPVIDMLKAFASSYGWDIIYDSGVMIGISKAETTITLEPGYQLEISLAPKFFIDEIKTALFSIDEKLKKTAECFGVTLLPYGINPEKNFSQINLLKKPRYKIMAQYLPQKGEDAPVMMRETASVQVNYDYCSEVDLIKKLKASVLISPFMTGLFANSPLRNNKFTGFKSNRALAWLNTDNDRCGFFYSKILEPDFSLNDYIQAILDVPMIFLQRDGGLIPLSGKINFRHFMQRGYCGYYPVIDDFNRHLSLCFPDVRVKNCIEIRNHDCQNYAMTFAALTLYKGVLYGNQALDEILELFSDMNFTSLLDLKYNACKFGLDFQYKNKPAKFYVSKIIDLARNSLKSASDFELKYLEPLVYMAKQGLCPADLIINSGINNSSSLIEYLVKNP